MARTSGSAQPIPFPIGRADPPANDTSVEALVRDAVGPILDRALRPTLETYRAIRLTADNLTLDDAAVGRRVRQIMAEAER